MPLTDGTHTAHIAFNGNYLDSSFHVRSDGHGGTAVFDPHANAPAITHQFIAAAAGLGARFAGPVSVSHTGWQPHTPILARPAMMMA